MQFSRKCIAINKNENVFLLVTYIFINLFYFLATLNCIVSNNFNTK